MKNFSTNQWDRNSLAQPLPANQQGVRVSGLNIYASRPITLLTNFKKRFFYRPRKRTNNKESIHRPGTEQTFSSVYLTTVDATG